MRYACPSEQRETQVRPGENGVIGKSRGRGRISLKAKSKVSSGALQHPSQHLVPTLATLGHSWRPLPWFGRGLEKGAEGAGEGAEGVSTPVFHRF
jgi:hypothetical protein